MSTETEAKKRDNAAIEKKNESLWNAMKRHDPQAKPVIGTSGEGSWFTDLEGNRFFDGVSGLWCLNLGHGQEEIVEAAASQMRAEEHTSELQSRGHLVCRLLLEKKKPEER